MEDDASRGDRPHGRAVGRERTCPACAEPVARLATRCRACGERLRARPRPRAPARDPVFAAALAAFLPGVGHIYCGRVAAGLLIMVAPPVVLVVAWLGVVVSALRAGVNPNGVGVLLSLASLAFWAWQVLDAHASARPRVAPRRRRGDRSPRG